MLPKELAGPPGEAVGLRVGGGEGLAWAPLQPRGGEGKAGGATLRLNTSLSHFDLWVGGEVGVELSAAGGGALGATGGWEGEVELVRPTGGVERVSLDLSELEGAEAVGPGVRRSFRATEKGLHRVAVELEHPESGVQLWGAREFFVTDRNDFPSLTEESAERSHWELHTADPDFLVVRVPVRADNQASHVHMHAEVHWEGASSNGGPVAWVAGMVTPEACPWVGNTASCLSLSLHRGWLSRAAAADPERFGDVSGGSLVLRYLRLKDPDHEVIVGHHDGALPLVDARGSKSWLEEALRNRKFPAEAAQPQISLLEVRMREGPLAEAWVNGVAKTSAQASEGEVDSTPQLLLVGGFCATEAPFPLSHFHGAISAVWESGMDAGNDKFARHILAFAKEKSLERYAGIGHSQAGNALLHVKTFYWSGMDRVTGGAAMQSVASPFHGASIMNFRQYLPSFIFCDFIQDVTPEGAAAWLRDIPAWSRAYANIYFTTSHGFFSCNPASSLIMDGSCNDGVVECDRTVLSGANFTQGPVSGGTDEEHGCHLGIPYFTEKANSHDKKNNHRMDAWAAREPKELR